MKIISQILKATFLMFIATVVLMTACKKDSNSSSTSTSDNGSAASMSANGATADGKYDDAFNIAMQTGNDQGLDNLMQKNSGKSTEGFTPTGSFYCATVTSSGSTFPVTITVDFGAGCKSADSITRSGSITYVFSGHISTIRTTISATFNNYVVNGYALTGTYSITNSTTNIASPSLTTTVTNGSITYPNDTSYSFSGTKTVALVSGSISNVSTLVFNVTGGYNVSNSFGESLAATITTPLERKETCEWVDAGIVSFKYTKQNVSVNGTLDYGNGTCDDSALITIGAFTETVTIL